MLKDSPDGAEAIVSHNEIADVPIVEIVVTEAAAGYHASCHAAALSSGHNNPNAELACQGSAIEHIKLPEEGIFEVIVE
ncbi:hypothetical protein KKF55_04560 [Patescibacteria group bacterium]|nr:hypothetical protein [Patescibacteria group bacterium]